MLNVGTTYTLEITRYGFKRKSTIIGWKCLLTKQRRREAYKYLIQEFYDTLKAHIFSNLPLTLGAAGSDKILNFGL